MSSFSYSSYRSAETSSPFQLYWSYQFQKGQTDYLVDRIGENMSQQTSRLESAMSDLGASVEKSADKISASVEGAAALLGGYVQEINKLLDKGIRTLDSIDSSLWCINEQLNLANLALSDIGSLLRIPDSEKERMQNISRGIRYYVSAQSDPELFIDALEFFKKAEAQHRQDFFVLKQIGMIYMYSEDLYDPNLALEYFKRSAKYARVESSINLESEMTSAAGNVYANAISDAKGQLIDALTKAAFTAYVLGDIEKAISNQQEACRLSSETHQTYLLAKYQAHNGDLDLALQNLKSVIQSEPAFVAAVLNEVDFVERPEIINYILSLDEEAKKTFDIFLVQKPLPSVRDLIKKTRSASLVERILLGIRLKKGEFYDVEKEKALLRQILRQLYDDYEIGVEKKAGSYLLKGFPSSWLETKVKKNFEFIEVRHVDEYVSKFIYCNGLVLKASDYKIKPSDLQGGIMSCPTVKKIDASLAEQLCNSKMQICQNVSVDGDPDSLYLWELLPFYLNLVDYSDAEIDDLFVRCYSGIKRYYDFWKELNGD